MHSYLSTGNGQPMHGTSSVPIVSAQFFVLCRSRLLPAGARSLGVLPLSGRSPHPTSRIHARQRLPRTRHRRPGNPSTRGKSGPALGGTDGVPPDAISVPADSASEIVKFCNFDTS